LHAIRNARVKVREHSLTCGGEHERRPRGGQLSGGQAIRSRYEQDARSFDAGSENTLEILHASASGDVGYWVGFQRTQARMQGSGKPVPMNLRVTEIFRREGGASKLIHRHADMLAEPQP
jgi:ketosteroid isomerase-like protein